MTERCGALRWQWIDEVEALGAETMGELEENIRTSISSKSPWKYNAHKQVRPFGGVNTGLLGDFWQLRPTGQVAIMSNPFAQVARENQRAQQMMGMFWYSTLTFSLQEWRPKQRVIHLDVNERSGSDVWYSQVLNECREGQLTEDNYNFLHGYETSARITTWYAHRCHNGGAHAQPLCNYTPYCIHDH